MLSIARITDGLYFVKQDKSIHPLSTSNGYLVDLSAFNSDQLKVNRESVLIDVNLEEKGWVALKEFCLKQDIPLPSKLFLSHCHLDHSSHAHFFSVLFNGEILAPEPEVEVILEHDGFFNVYQITEMKEFPALLDSYHHLKYEILEFGIIPKSKITTFLPGEVFRYPGIEMKTIPLTTHSPGHVGILFSIPRDDLTIFHNSCLGLDHLKISKEGIPKDGFGP